jgi:predicted TIM-barrel enzyme
VLVSTDIPVRFPLTFSCVFTTGVQAERLAETLAIADGVIVGTSLKVDGPPPTSTSPRPDGWA